MIPVCEYHKRPMSSLCCQICCRVPCHIPFYKECVKDWLFVILAPKEKIIFAVYLLCKHRFNVEIQRDFSGSHLTSSKYACNFREMSPNYISIPLGSNDIPTEREEDQKVHCRVLPELPPPDSGVDFSLILTTATFNVIALMRQVKG